MAVRLPGVKQN